MLKTEAQRLRRKKRLLESQKSELRFKKLIQDAQTEYIHKLRQSGMSATQMIKKETDWQNEPIGSRWPENHYTVSSSMSFGMEDSDTKEMGWVNSPIEKLEGDFKTYEEAMEKFNQLYEEIDKVEVASEDFEQEAPLHPFRTLVIEDRINGVIQHISLLGYKERHGYEWEWDTIVQSYPVDVTPYMEYFIIDIDDDAVPGDFLLSGAPTVDDQPKFRKTDPVFKAREDAIKACVGDLRDLESPTDTRIANVIYDFYQKLFSQTKLGMSYDVFLQKVSNLYDSQNESKDMIKTNKEKQRRRKRLKEAMASFRPPSDVVSFQEEVYIFNVDKNTNFIVEFTKDMVKLQAKLRTDQTTTIAYGELDEVKEKWNQVKNDEQYVLPKKEKKFTGRDENWLESKEDEEDPELIEDSSEDQVIRLAKELGLEVDADTILQLIMGMAKEKEHGDLISDLVDITGGDEMIEFKIVMAHIMEIPDYYTRLEAMEAEARAELDEEVPEPSEDELESSEEDMGSSEEDSELIEESKKWEAPKELWSKNVNEIAELIADGLTDSTQAIDRLNSLGQDNTDIGTVELGKINRIRNILKHAFDSDLDESVRFKFHKAEYFFSLVCSDAKELRDVEKKLKKASGIVVHTIYPPKNTILVKVEDNSNKHARSLVQDVVNTFNGVTVESRRRVTF